VEVRRRGVVGAARQASATADMAAFTEAQAFALPGHCQTCHHQTEGAAWDPELRAMRYLAREIAIEGLCHD